MITFKNEAVLFTIQDILAMYENTFSAGETLKKAWF